MKKLIKSTSAGSRAHYVKKNVYSIVNRITGRTYFGSNDGYINQRFANHRSALRGGRHSSSALQSDWDKYGEDAFDFRVVVSSDILSAIEIVVMELALIKTNRNCYNKAKTGKPVSEETRRKISEGNRSIDPVKVHRAEIYLAAGLSVSETAKALNISKSTVYAIRRQNSEIPTSGGSN